MNMMDEKVDYIQQWNFAFNTCIPICTNHLLFDAKRNEWLTITSDAPGANTYMQISLVDANKSITSQYPYKYELCNGPNPNIVIYDHYFIVRTYGYANDVIFILDMDTSKHLKIRCEEYYFQANNHQSDWANDHAMIVKDRKGMTRHILYENVNLSPTSVTRVV